MLLLLLTATSEILEPSRQRAHEVIQCAGMDAEIFGGGQTEAKPRETHALTRAARIVGPVLTEVPTAANATRGLCIAGGEGRTQARNNKRPALRLRTVAVTHANILLAPQPSLVRLCPSTCHTCSTTAPIGPFDSSRPPDNIDN